MNKIIFFISIFAFTPLFSMQRALVYKNHKENPSIDNGLSKKFIAASNLCDSDSRLQQVPFGTLIQLSSEKKETTRFLLEQTKEKDTVIATKALFNNTVKLPQPIKNCFPGKKLSVLAEWSDVLSRVGNKTVKGMLIGGSLGFVAGGIMGAQSETKNNVEKHTALVTKTQNEVFQTTFKEEYVEIHASKVLKKIEESNCISHTTADAFVAWHEHTCDNCSDVGSLYGQAIKAHNGDIPAAFSEAVTTHCFNKNNTSEVQMGAASLAVQRAELKASAAIIALSLPEVVSFSPGHAMEYGAYGAIAGGTLGIAKSIYDGDFTNPLIEKEIPQITHTI